MSDFGSIQASRALVELVEDLQKAPEDTTFLGFLSHGSTPKSSICLGDVHGFSIINDPFGGSNIFGNQKIEKSTRATVESPIFVGYTTPPSSMTETEVAKFMGETQVLNLSDESIGRSSMELYPSKCWSGYVFQIWIYAKVLVKDCKGAYSPLNF